MRECYHVLVKNKLKSDWLICNWHYLHQVFLCKAQDMPGQSKMLKRQDFIKFKEKTSLKHSWAISFSTCAFVAQTNKHRHLFAQNHKICAHIFYHQHKNSPYLYTGRANTKSPLFQCMYSAVYKSIVMWSVMFMIICIYVVIAAKKNNFIL